MTEFVKPDGRPDDRAWLYDQVFDLISTPSPWEEKFFGGQPQPRSEQEIYQRYAPTSPGSVFTNIRPSWAHKNRKVKREMLAAVLRRLIADGKIKVRIIRAANLKSMHGVDVRNRKTNVHLFGPKHDGLHRVYSETNVLQAMADALEVSE
jgi:hypothetical protein